MFEYKCNFFNRIITYMLEMKTKKKKSEKIERIKRFNNKEKEII